MEYLLILLGGMLGSGHCVGMCGAFAIMLGQGDHSSSRNLSRQLFYSSGRVLTYALLGAMCGFGGWRLNTDLTSVLNLQALLSVFAGLLLVCEGLFSLGWLRRPFVSACPGASEFAALLRARSGMAVFAAGLLNGLLPCGLVYAYLALSSSSADMLQGALIMIAFGLGTWPAMILTGMAGAFMKGELRKRIVALAAVALFATGILTISRGVLAFKNSATEESSCPFCMTQ
jgi:sulfite exporter TauE/SafE